MIEAAKVYFQTFSLNLENFSIDPVSESSLKILKTLKHKILPPFAQ
jgi:hypothetical protein